MKPLNSKGGFRRFDLHKMNLMALICFRVSQEESDIISFSFKELEESMQMKVFDIEKSSYFKELTQMSWVTKDTGSDVYTPVFLNYEVNREKNRMYFFINSKARKNLVEVGIFFDNESLNIFLDLSSSYAKAAYFLILEMKLSDNYTISIESFRHILAIPNTYKMSDIDKKVFKQIETQLKIYYPSLTIEKINSGKGNTIGFLTFHLEG